MKNTNTSWISGNTRARMATARESFRPKNMTREEFLGSPDLEYINGPFSTFDPDYSRLIKKTFTNPHAIMAQAIFSMNATKDVAKEYLSELNKLNNKYKHIHSMFMRMALIISSEKYTGYLRLLTHNLIHNMTISAPAPHVFLIDSWDDVPSDITPPKTKRDTLMGLCIRMRYQMDKTATYIILVHRPNIAKIYVKERIPLHVAILGTLAHEFSHYVDCADPNRGALGAQYAAHLAPQSKISEYSASIIDKIVIQTLGRAGGR